MISTEGMLTVAEAARRLHRSEEQVRRNLRSGKLRGQRIGNQWFVEDGQSDRQDSERLIPKALLDEIDRTREAIFKRNGIVFDVVEMLRKDRDSH
ncbi:MAG TPA: helix-turn-helix domain-containing protein [Dehalococcoidia bacterium]|jgi:excisionase family DNA binding protein